jgi:hypothetical protein
MLSNFFSCNPQWYGSHCQCNVPYQTQATTAPLELDLTRSLFAADTLTVVLVEGIQYSGEMFGVGTSGCGSNFSWSSADEGCTKVWTGVVPWADVVANCAPTREVLQAGQQLPGGAAGTVPVSSIVYALNLWVTAEQPLGVIRGTTLTQTQRSSLTLEVVFPLSVNVTSNPVDVFAPVLALSAVTSEVMVSNVNQAHPSATVQLYTQVEWPFQLTAPRWVSMPTGVVQAIAPFEMNANSAAYPCANAVGALCEQNWGLQLGLPGTCFLSGTYTLRTTIVCRELRASSCPLDAAVNTADFSFTLTSPSLCTQVVQTLDLSATLKSYKDAAHTVLKADFVEPEVLYFQAPTSSKQASISMTEIVDVRVLRPSGAVVVLLDGSDPTSQGVMTAAGAATSFRRTDGGASLFDVASLPSFEFAMIAATIGLATDQIEGVVVQATVLVRYTNAGQPTLQTVRMEMQGGSSVTASTVGASALVSLGAKSGSRSGSSASGSAAGASADMGVVAGVAIAAIVVLTVVAVVALRRRHTHRMHALATSVPSGMVHGDAPTSADEAEADAAMAIGGGSAAELEEDTATGTDEVTAYLPGEHRRALSNVSASTASGEQSMRGVAAMYAATMDDDADVGTEAAAEGE